MAVSFHRNGESVQVRPDPTRPIPREDTGTLIKQFEVFGRLNCNQKTICEYLGASNTTVAELMRRTDIRRAFDRGRSEAVIAVRQKMLAAALGGSERMLLHAGQHFAELQGQDGERDPRGPGGERQSWGSELAERAKAIRDKVMKDAG